MHPSTFMTLFGAGLAVASPVVREDVMTEYVTDVVYVTVSGLKPVITQTFHQTQSHHHKTSLLSLTSVVVQSTSTQAAPYLPATTQTTAVPTAETSAITVISSSTSEAAPFQTVDASSGLPTGIDFDSTVIYHHNIHRRNHSSPDVSYDNTIAGYASQVANSCNYAHDLTPGGGGYGQNIAAFGTTNNAAGFNASHIVAQAVTDLWYNNEIDFFLPSYYGLPNGGGNFEDWGHFSQIVWTATTGVGCSAVFCSSASSPFSPGMPWWFTVCNYSPPGNMGGEYGSNISPPLGYPTVVVN